MILGYSCWGFLGEGIRDTPDGGRSHRLPLLRALVGLGFEIVMLQRDRDRVEAGSEIRSEGIRFEGGLPSIDALLLEYRWPIPGRNTGISPYTTGYTPDLDRQLELISHYGHRRVPILVWDKDRKLRDDAGLLGNYNYIVLEAALWPTPGRRQLLFPADCAATQAARLKLAAYRTADRSVDLVYIGNGYERDESFEEFIVVAAERLETRVPVYGNWQRYTSSGRGRSSFIAFEGRVHFRRVSEIYSRCLATVLIAPDRYYESGQYTQRLFESTWGGCIALTPSRYSGAAGVVQGDWIVESGEEVADAVTKFRSQSDDATRRSLDEQLSLLLDRFSPRDQAQAIVECIAELYGNR